MLERLYPMELDLKVYLSKYNIIISDQFCGYHIL